MRRIKIITTLVAVAISMFLFSCSMKKIKDIKDKFDEPEQVENGIISDDSLAHASETEDTTPAVKSTTETGEITAESSAPKKVFTGKVYEIVEDMPTFPGGVTELMNYLSKNTHYPAATKKRWNSRTSCCFFHRRTRWFHSNVKLVRSIDANLDREALRVVSENAQLDAR